MRDVEELMKSLITKGYVTKSEDGYKLLDNMDRTFSDLSDVEFSLLRGVQDAVLDKINENK